MNPPSSVKAQVTLIQRILQTTIDQQMISYPLLASMEGEYPLPIRDFMQEPAHPIIMAMPYHQMLFGYLLRLHPLHPHGHNLDCLYYCITKGPVAQLFLSLREIVHLHQRHTPYFNCQDLHQP